MPSGVSAKVLDAPILMSAVAADDEVNLSWSNVKGARGYIVRQGISSGTYGADTQLGKILSYTASGLTNGTIYFFVIAATRKNSLSLDSNEVSATPTASLAGGGEGVITRNVWMGIRGRAVSDLIGSTNFPDNPDITDTLTSFEGPLGFGNSYGTQVHGYIHPPVTGNYTFWIAADDTAELHLSTNFDPVIKQLIASVNTKTKSRQWNKSMSQQSAPISLTAGEIYYVEVLHKEDRGGDHISVAWQIPGGIQELIDGQYLSTYTSISLPDVPVLNTATARDAQVDLNWSAVAGADGYKVQQGTASGVFDITLDVVNVISYTVTGLTNDTNYFFVVNAYNIAGDGSNSNELSATPFAPPQPPLAPTLNSALPGDSIVDLNWSSVIDADGYRVKSGVASGVYDITTDVGNVADYTFNGTNGTTYYFVVVAYNADGDSPDSNELSAAPINILPTYTIDQCTGGVSSASSCLQGCASQYSHTRAFDDVFDVADGWVSNATPTGWIEYAFASPKTIVRYTIDPRAYPPGNPVDWTFEAYDDVGTQWIILDTQVGQTWAPPQSNEYTFNNTNSYTRYRLNISANGGHGEVGFTEMEMMELATAGTPSAISDLQATYGDTFVDLTWSEPSNGGSLIINYEVQYGIEASGLFDQIIVDDQNPGATVSGLTNGTVYQFRVISVNAIGVSGPSNAVLALPFSGTQVSGTINTDTIWTLSNSPYIITGNITVVAGATLTIEAGVEVYFTGFYSLITDGVLNAQGNDGNFIQFKSLGATPAAGNWNTIELNDAASVLDYVQIEHADRGIHVPSGYAPTPFSYTNQVTIQNSIIQNNNNGIYFESNTAPNIIRNSITGNTNGIFAGCHAISKCKPVIYQNEIYGNFQYNFQAFSYGTNSSGITINAEYNWWGSVDSATIALTIEDINDNPSLPVVDFDPYLTVPLAQVIDITNNDVNNRFFDTRRLETAAIEYTLDTAAQITIQIYDDLTQALVRTLVDDQLRSVGFHSETWDGKDDAVLDLPEGSYLYIIDATAAGAMIGSYNPVFKPDAIVDVLNVQVVPAGIFEPYKGERLEISYDLSAPADITLKIEDTTIFSDQPRGLTNNTDYWDGRLASGKVVSSTLFILVKLYALALPENIIHIQYHANLKIDNLTTDPYVMRPLMNEVTQIQYSITEAADVTVEILTPDAGAVLATLESSVSKGAGVYSVEWDGRTDAGGAVADPGDYRVRVKADDSFAETVTRDGNIRIFF